MAGLPRQPAAWLALAALAVRVAGQAMGDGISKYTLPCNDPIPRIAWLEEYLPVVVAADSCLDESDDGNDALDTCTCNSSEYGVWEEKEARVQLYHQKGFGIHMVNSSGRITEGGMTVEAMEQVFHDKLGNMTEFDSFMDYNLGLHLPPHGNYSLDALISRFDEGGEPYFPYTWTQPLTNETYYGVFVRVPHSMLVLELVSNVSNVLGAAAEHGFELTELEPRVSTHVLSYIESTPTNYSVRPIHVSRAASDVDAVDDFYTAIRTARTVEYDSGNVSKKCYLWGGAEVEVCYTQRPDSATRGGFTVSDFEDMLNGVHEAVVAPNPNCQRDKWTDFHYAYDNGQVSGQQIYEYVALKPDAYFVCTGAYVMYVVDPAGFTVQLDINGDYTLSACDDSDWDWSIDADHGGCVLGNCTPLGANFTLEVVDLASLLDDDAANAATDDDDDGAREALRKKKIGAGRKVLIASIAFVLTVLLVTAFKDKCLKLNRGAQYKKLPDDEPEDTSHLE